MSNQITSRMMLQVLMATIAISIVGYFALTYASSESVSVSVNQPVYAQNISKAVQSVPQPTQTTPSYGGDIYVVQSGDTLYKIACLHNVTLGALQMANQQLQGDLIHPGESLSIPTTSLGNPHHCHVVEQGENINMIASLHGTSVQDIVASNPRKAERIKDWVRPGEVLYIPRRAYVGMYLEDGKWICAYATPMPLPEGLNSCPAPE